MESTTINPPVLVESLKNNQKLFFPVYVIDETIQKKNEEKAFKRRLEDTQRRFDQAWVCGNSRVVAKISYELDALKLEAKEKGFEF